MNTPRPSSARGDSPGDPTRPPSHRRIRSLIRLAAGISALGFIIAAGAAVTRPGWHQPRSIDFRVLPDDKAELLTLENRISEALNANHAVTVEIEEAQVNRWLAARQDLLANLIALPLDLERPSVRFDATGIRLATTRRVAGWNFIISAGGMPRISGDAVHLDDAHAAVGRLAVPLRWVVSWLPPARSDKALLDLRNLRMNRLFVWTNGERRCQLTELECRPGVVRVTLAPVDGAVGPRVTAP